ncbi:MAG: hypothetical protein ACXACX_05590 [Candidatus Hodarchaeales archaeon]|jgi:GTPase SAR1 family protein
MKRSIQSIKNNEIFCRYCKRNSLLAGLNQETQICFQCEEILDNFVHSPYLVDKNAFDKYERDYLILKTIILGDIHSNKTQLFRNYINNYLNHSYQPTIGLDIAGKDISYNNRLIRVTISVISYLKRFKIIRREFYSGTNIAFLVFDTTSEDSIKEVETVWSNELADYEKRIINQARILKILIGNKWESHSDYLLTKDEVEKLAEKLNCYGCVLSNAHGEILDSNIRGTMNNLHDIFIQVISKYLETSIPQPNL